MEREFRSHYHTRASSVAYNHNGEPDLLLQWGNRKRLRCVKVQRRDDVSNKPATAVRVDRRVVRAEKEPPAIPTRHRILRNNSEAMRSQQQINGATASPEKVSEDNNDKNNNIINTTTTNNNNNNNNSNKKGGSGGAGGGEGSSSASEGAAWPPKFVIALTNKEKEEDFMLFRGSKLPQRPKKRPKVIQRTLNLVCPGSWLCDLTLERYEVREKKLSKKRPRGLKAMGNMESDSE